MNVLQIEKTFFKYDPFYEIQTSPFEKGKPPVDFFKSNNFERGNFFISPRMYELIQKAEFNDEDEDDNKDENTLIRDDDIVFSTGQDQTEFSDMTGYAIHMFRGRNDPTRRGVILKDLYKTPAERKDFEERKIQQEKGGKFIDIRSSMIMGEELDELINRKYMRIWTPDNEVKTMERDVKKYEKKMQLKKVRAQQEEDDRKQQLEEVKRERQARIEENKKYYQNRLKNWEDTVRHTREYYDAEHGLLGGERNPQEKKTLLELQKERAEILKDQEDRLRDMMQRYNWIENDLKRKNY